ncbi:MAG: SufS family cysteine desulfurase [Alphaproteobacteria bacterium]|nr:SufS family cysteine desulfurase [Alphaproteobacteria bacterium]
MNKPVRVVPFDVEAVRAQFPILRTLLHGKVPLHYLDNAATAQVPEAVLEAVRAHDALRRANVKRGVHALAEAATDAYEAARRKVAQHLNAREEREIVFTSGTTGAINLVANAFGATLKPGDEVVLSGLEHHSNLVPWQLLRDRAGIKLRFLGVTEEGRIDTGDLDELVSERCKLIAVTHVSNVTGAITDVAAVVRAARTVGARVLLDGAQRASHGPVDVQALGVDFYALSSHKMFGPTGVGALWGRAEVLASLPPFLGGGEMIRTVTLEKSTWADIPARFEAGTPPITQAVGLGAAIDWQAGVDTAAAAVHTAHLADRILDGLRSLGGANRRIRVIGPQTMERRFPVIAFAVEGAHPHDICQMLDGHGVALRGGHHCAQPFHDSLGLAGTSRASLALYNNAGDVDAFLTGLDDALTKLT